MPLPHADVLRDLKLGDRLLIDDGQLEMRVSAKQGEDVTCEVVTGGELHSRKGVSIPNSSLSMSSITERDREDVRFAIEQGVDYIAMSFVRSAEDLRELRWLVHHLQGEVGLIAKIEKAEAINNFEAILDQADGIMVARGDLGVETPAERVPVHQKEIIRRCNQVGKPVITATQMLNSMIDIPRPTRAEASDVANAIYDATSAVMLSGETAIGAYPVEAVRTMADIALVVEADIERAGRAPQPWTAERAGVSNAISYGACEVAYRVGAAAIVTATYSGATARAVARNMPTQPIVAVSPNQRVVNQLALCWGVCPLLGGRWGSFEEIVAEANDFVLANALGQRAQVVVVTAGLQTNQPGKTNLIKAHVLD